MSALNKLAGLLGFFSGETQVSNRNHIVDGNFQAWINTPWSPGVSGYGNNAAAMYYVYAGTNGNATWTRNYFAAGSEPKWMTPVPMQTYMKHQQGTAASGDRPYIIQHIESARTLQGRSATFSCVLWVDSGSITIPSVSCAQMFGSGGSVSPAGVADRDVSWVVTTTPKKFSIRLDLPSVSGKTFGTNNNDFLQVGIFLPTGVTFGLNTTQWQMEACSPLSNSDTNGNGGAPTAFEYRGTTLEELRWQRFYQAGIIGGYSTNNYISFVQPIPVVMRGNPSVSINDQNGNYGKINTSNGFNVSINGGIVIAYQERWFVDAIVSAVCGNWWRCQYTLDARI